jgi:tetratricopeptide (TPR) repeat protein
MNKFHHFFQQYDCPYCYETRHHHQEHFRPQKSLTTVMESFVATIIFLVFLLCLTSCGNEKTATDFQKSALEKNHAGQYEAAILDCNEAIRLDPKFAEPYNNRGWAKYNLGSYDEAIVDFTKSIELKYSFIKPHVNRGNAYLKLKKYSDAERDFDNAIAINPNYKNAYRYKGDLYKAQNKQEEATLWYKKADNLNN